MLTDQDTSGTPSLPTITYAPRPTTTTQIGTSSGTRTSSVQQRQAQITQNQTVRDTSTGTALVTPDVKGFGLDRPYLGWNSYPTAQETTPPASTASGSFVALHTLATEPQHPKIRVRFRAITGAGTAGEIRLRDRATGQVLVGGGPFVVGIAATVEDQLDGTLVNPVLSSIGGAGTPMKVDVEARVTAGANAIAVLILYAIGKGT